MADRFWVSLAQAVQSWATAIAILVGGAWAYYRFGIKRENETALAIDLAHSSVPYDSNYLVVFDVCLENKGSVRLGAKRKRHSAYTDDAEALAYSVNLLLRPVPPSSRPGSRIGGFNSGTDKSPRPDDLEFDLVAEYEIDGETDFWMEPDENYHVGATVVLSAGKYLAMVTFVGDRSDSEFWRRMFLVQVPVPQAAASTPAA